MRLFLTSLFTLLCSVTLSAQSLTIVESAGAQAAITSINSSSSKLSSVNGYRVGIFFDNSQDARSLATAAKTKFEQNFPDVAIYMVYESPYYKVSAGDCQTEEEAVVLFEKIRSVFPDAYVMREDMELSTFVESGSLSSTNATTTAVSAAGSVSTLNTTATEAKSSASSTLNTTATNLNSTATSTINTTATEAKSAASSTLNTTANQIQSGANVVSGTLK